MERVFIMLFIFIVGLFLFIEQKNFFYDDLITEKQFHLYEIKKTQGLVKNKPFVDGMIEKLFFFALIFVFVIYIYDIFTAYHNLNEKN